MTAKKIGHAIKNYFIHEEYVVKPKRVTATKPQENMYRKKLTKS